MTIAQAAELLQVHIKSAYAMASRRQLPVARISSGRKGLRIDRLELERRLERQCREQTGAALKGERL